MNVTGPYWWLVNIGMGNGWVLSRQQTITWANADPELCRQMASLGHNEVKVNVLFSTGTINRYNNKSSINIYFFHALTM